MPVNLIWEPLEIICKCTDVVTRMEMMKAGFLGFYDDERNMEARYQIFDAYEASELRLKKKDVILLASTAVGRSRLVPNIRAAIIAPMPQVRQLKRMSDILIV